MARKRKQATKSNTAVLPVMRPDAAGIDIGATEIFVAVPADRAPENVRSFPTFTQDLYALADWLKQCGIRTVAMESTGVYWIPLFQILEEREFEVCLVNARHVKNVPGRRTDVSDCQWLQFLHSVGLLRASGPDFTKFRSASAFASWMGLCPDNDISGGKVLWVGTRKVNCRAATALRMAAQSLHHSKSALGDFYRRMRAKLGAPKAITAAAHKLARIIFHLVSARQEFDDSKFAADQLRYQESQQIKLRAKAKAMGYELVPLERAG